MAYTLSPGRKLFSTFNVILFVMIMIGVLFPLWMAFATSVAPDRQVIQGDFVMLPQSFNLNCYVVIFQSGGYYLRSFIISVLVAVVGTILSIVLTLFTGYALAQKDLIGRRFFMGFIFVTLVFNAGIIPFYMVVRNLGMIDKYWALFVPVLLHTYYLILMKNYMLSIPESLIESARLDGCSELGILFKIVVPVSIPILAAITLFYVVFYWNQYINVVMFINDNQKYTIQVLLRQLIFNSTSAVTGANRVYPNFKMAVMFVAMLPVLALYPFIQRYFISGLMLGSIKE